MAASKVIATGKFMLKVGIKVINATSIDVILIVLV